MDLVEVCTTSEVKEGVLKSVDVEGIRLMVTLLDGKYIVASRICTHKTFDLAQSPYSDGYVTCKLHTSTFDLKDDGEAMNPPAVDPLDIYETVVRNEMIYINL